MNQLTTNGGKMDLRSNEARAFLCLPGSKGQFAVGEYLNLGAEEILAGLSDDPEISPRHARIEKKEKAYLLRDLRSGAGTFVNETRISEAWLQEGDEIRIGQTRMVFTFQSLENTRSGLLSRNKSWQEQLDRLPAIARTEYPILLLGASGTGKEIIANRIHELSRRAGGPFIRVNCSALAETLIESELFGHVKGSFTGAIADRKGAFEAARGGTLLLDEIGDLPYSLQAKLLRALENTEVRPVGSDRTIQTDVRIVASTHQNLPARIQDGTFRQDLYYRLNVVVISPPPLVDRMEDFEDLLYQFAKQMRVRFSFNAIAQLKRHNWPGNVRELRNTVARAGAMFPGIQIEESHIPSIIDQIKSDQGAPLSPLATGLPIVKEFERQMILKRLAANHGNQRRTAADLGMPKSTLHDRLKLYNIDAQTFVRQPG